MVTCGDSSDFSDSCDFSNSNSLSDSSDSSTCSDLSDYRLDQADRNDPFRTSEKIGKVLKLDIRIEIIKYAFYYWNDKLAAIILDVTLDVTLDEIFGWHLLS